MSYSKSIIQIYIQCRNRPKYLHEAINSFKHQLQKDVELIISDNSTNSKVFDLVSSKFPDLRYRRRMPPLSPENHCKTIIEESTGDYLVIFHDDDRVLPGYVKTLLRTIDEGHDVSAIAPNGRFIDERGDPAKFYGPMVKCGFSGGRRTLFPINLADAYFSPKSFGTPPFSGYAYNKRYLTNDLLRMSDGGKHADVSLLIKMSKMKPILWLDCVLVESRRHGKNDSAKENIYDRLSLKKYLMKEGFLTRGTKTFDFFRFQYWFVWWLQNQGVTSLFLSEKGWRRAIVRRIILTKSIIYFIQYTKLRKAFLRKLLNGLF